MLFVEGVHEKSMSMIIAEINAPAKTAIMSARPRKRTASSFILAGNEPDM